MTALLWCWCGSQLLPLALRAMSGYCKAALALWPAKVPLLLATRIAVNSNP